MVPLAGKAGNREKTYRARKLRGRCDFLSETLVLIDSIKDPIKLRLPLLTAFITVRR